MSVKSTLLLNGVDVPIKLYSDGSVDISVSEQAIHSLGSRIELNSKCPSGPLALFILLDYLQSVIVTSRQTFTVVLGYLPFGRQDRITGSVDSHPFSLRTFCNTLQSFSNIHYIVLVDPHSNVSEALINSPVEVRSQLELFQQMDDMYSIGNTVDFVISPDQGAFKKSKLIADYVDVPLLVANKSRDQDTNEITLSFMNNVDLKDKVVLIPDDIIDYGTSIKELSSLLKSAYKVKHVIVYATHGILPVNLRLPVPSRYSFVMENVDELYLYSLWSDNSHLEVVPSNVSFVELF